MLVEREDHTRLTWWPDSSEGKPMAYFREELKWSHIILPLGRIRFPQRWSDQYGYMRLLSPCPEPGRAKYPKLDSHCYGAIVGPTMNLGVRGLRRCILFAFLFSSV